jgi:carbamate kinase
MKLVIGLGGNALLERGQPPEAGIQRANAARAASAIAPLTREHTLVITHGNGPQVGLLALQSEGVRGIPAYPLDLLDAETEGLLGYLIEQEMRNRLPDRQIVTLLTQIVVDGKDPAFQRPTKPIGPLYEKQEADRLSRERGWFTAKDGTGYRRVVPSPEPRRILEMQTIGLLVEAGVVVICAGGGGIPVTEGKDGVLHGVEAVIDKDLATALLAIELGADGLLLLTDVDAVYLDWSSSEARPIGQVSAAELRRHDFAPGSMGPKVEAVCRFIEQGGSWAGIGSLTSAAEILQGKAGTRVQA